MNPIVKADLDRIYNGLSEDEKEKLRGSTILLTGCAGFLGFYLMHFFSFFYDDLNIKGIIGLDNFKLGYPKWLEKLNASGKIQLEKFDIITDDVANIKSAYNADYIYHMASIASPVFYRANPIETLDANIWGLRRLLEFYKDKPIKGMVFFSSSEIYGDPDPKHIPTPETYWGHVDCTGPRACYDEAKRFGETMCYLFNQKYEMPITVIRPFNNYGPGMRLNDKRVPADFAKAIYENRDIIILSDGSPTRTFCYISDAITGYIKGLVYGKYDNFNIGIDNPEISIKDVAKIYKSAGKEIFNYTGNVIYEKPEEKEYLSNNPNRRCPVIEKARRLLNYNPTVTVELGVKYFLEYIKNAEEGELEW